MSQRILCAIAAFMVVGATSYLAARQAPSPTTQADANWAQPRTAWGDPDIQGIWSYATTTPLQRPVELGNKEFYTEEEAAARDAQRAAAADAAPQAGQTGTYDSVWFDRGSTALNRRTSLIIEPANGRFRPFTAEGQKRLADRAAYRRDHPADSWRDLNPEERCIMYHGVPPLPTGYNNTYQVFQIPGYVAILDESIHDVRMIPLDGRPHLGKDIRHWNGDSRGRWDGNTLVVETTNYRPDTVNGFPSSENLHAVERFTRVSRDVMELQFTITDPSIYTSSWTALLPMRRTEEKIYEYACHEGNHAMVGILAGARAEEKAKADAGAKR